MPTPHRLSALVLVALVLVAAAAAATKPKPKPNDGLPTKWYGYTVWSQPPNPGRVSRDATFAEVTLTLKKKQAYSRKAPFTIGAKGTFYSYLPSGPIRVWGHCNVPVNTTLAADDGVLLITVSKGKPARAGYYGADTFRLRAKLPGTCPDGTSPHPSGAATWGFRTYESKPMPAPRRLSTSAKEIRGTYVESPSGLANTYEWCFTRLKNDSACLDVRPPSS